jgi:predicted RNase H-like nuclease
MRGGRAVLGIDAAWTEIQPSGVALAEEIGGEWRLATVAASYADFGANRTDLSAASAAGLISASEAVCGRAPAIVAVDMPLANTPIVARREADNAVSRAYGARHCSTHTPSAIRPGPVSDRLRAGFTDLGYQLATQAIAGPSLIEVYPHPALVELTGAGRRLPYKAAKVRAYWPGLAPAARRVRLIEVWADIIAALDGVIIGVSAALPLPRADAPVRRLKAFEDQLDAVVCAWSGICALEGAARPFGDLTAAVWIPTGPVTRHAQRSALSAFSSGRNTLT